MAAESPRPRLVNERTNGTVASVVEFAVTRTERRRGLLGRNGLDLSAALMLAPCPAVHTAFMRFAIDVVFVDREGRVRKIVRGLAPWRISASPSNATSCPAIACICRVLMMREARVS